MKCNLQINLFSKVIEYNLSLILLWTLNWPSLKKKHLSVSVAWNNVGRMNIFCIILLSFVQILMRIFLRDCVIKNIVMDCCSIFIGKKNAHNNLPSSVKGHFILIYYNESNTFTLPRKCQGRFCTTSCCYNGPYVLYFLCDSSTI